MSAKRQFKRNQSKLLNDGKKFESRMLILADPEKKNNMQEWQAEVDRTTKKPWEKSAKETGYPVLIGGPIAFDSDASQNLDFPPNFCVYCGDVNVPNGKQARGIFIFNNGYPELGIKQLTRALHYMCHACADECVFPTRPEGLHLPDRTWKDARAEWHLRAEEHMVAYVRAQRQSGVVGNVFGSEERRRRASEQ